MAPWPAGYRVMCSTTDLIWRKITSFEAITGRTDFKGSPCWVFHSRKIGARSMHKSSFHLLIFLLIQQKRLTWHSGQIVYGWERSWQLRSTDVMHFGPTVWLQQLVKDYIFFYACLQYRNFIFLCSSNFLSKELKLSGSISIINFSPVEYYLLLCKELVFICVIALFFVLACAVFSRKVYARRYVHSPQYHLIITLIISRLMWLMWHSGQVALVRKNKVDSDSKSKYTNQLFSSKGNPIVISGRDLERFG